NFTVVAALLSSVLILFSQYSGPPNRHSFPSRRSSDLSLLLIGPIWKFPIDRFIFKPKILIGRSSFVAETIGVLLKERNSNTYYHLTLEPLSTRYKPFTYSVGFSSDYYLRKGLIFNLDLRYTGIMADIIYRQTTTELGNSHTTRATHNISKTMHIFTPGVGLSIAIL